MPTALESVEKEDPLTKIGVVGLRSLPQLKLCYYARAPKSNPFSTIWLPVNASKRQVTDDVQDVMYLYYSRHCKSDAGMRYPRRSFELDVGLVPEAHTRNHREFAMPTRRPPATADSVRAAMWRTDSNSISPFASLGKPTCGFYFSREIDNKKRLIGIPPTNLIRYRSRDVPPSA